MVVGGGGVYEVTVVFSESRVDTELETGVCIIGNSFGKIYPLYRSVTHAPNSPAVQLKGLSRKAQMDLSQQPVEWETKGSTF